MKTFKQFLLEAKNGKLVRVDDEIIPNENYWDNDNTWYGFEHNIRLSKNADFKWYDNCYADSKQGISNKLMRMIDTKCKQFAKPQEYKNGNDYYKILYYTLAEDPKAAAGSINFALAICQGGSRDTFWTGEFLAIRPQHVKEIENFLFS